MRSFMLRLGASLLIGSVLLLLVYVAPAFGCAGSLQ